MTANLTLGGMRPGSGLCVIPASPTRWWLPCLTRRSYGQREHAWFLSFTNDPSLYCWSCRAGKPLVVIVKKGVEYTADELYALARLQAPKRFPSALIPELSASPVPPSEFPGGRELLPSTPLREDVGGFVRPPRPDYRPATPAAWREEIAERAAIMEYLGGVARAVAEQMARSLIGPEPRKAV